MLMLPPFQQGLEGEVPLEFSYLRLVACVIFFTQRDSKVPPHCSISSFEPSRGTKARYCARNVALLVELYRLSCVVC